MQRLAETAGNRATRHALESAGPAQLHPNHDHEAPEPGQNRYEVLGVQVPRPRGGWKLQRDFRQQMERSFNTDLGGIRVKEDQSADDLDSLAYTRGADITVAPGHYQPHSGSGKRLLAHEIVHVIQQRADRVPAPTAAQAPDGGLPVNEDSDLESEADRLGRHAAWGIPASVRGSRDTVRHRPRGITQPHGAM